MENLLANPHTKTIIDIIGWIGGLEVLLAYLLISINKVDARSFFYQFLNATGALLLIINTIYLGAYPSALVNIVWVMVAGYSMGKYHWGKK